MLVWHSFGMYPGKGTSRRRGCSCRAKHPAAQQGARSRPYPGTWQQSGWLSCECVLTATPQCKRWRAGVQQRRAARWCNQTPWPSRDFRISSSFSAASFSCSASSEALFAITAHFQATSISIIAFDMSYCADSKASATVRTCGHCESAQLTHSRLSLYSATSSILERTSMFSVSSRQDDMGGGAWRSWANTTLDERINVSECIERIDPQSRVLNYFL